MQEMVLGVLKLVKKKQESKKGKVKHEIGEVKTMVK